MLETIALIIIWTWGLTPLWANITISVLLACSLVFRTTINYIKNSR